MHNDSIYSIIIPHHNIPDLLRRSLTSIPFREDIQVIIVDYCSDQEYLLSVKKIEEDFSWMKFIYSETAKDAGSARNIGLDSAIGKYIVFVDADDYFNYCIRELFDEYKDLDFDMLMFNAVSLDTDTYLFAYRGWVLNNIFEIAEKDKNKALYGLKYIFNEPWCRFVKKDIILKYNIRFDEQFIHNDLKFGYWTGYYSNNILLDNRAAYCVTNRRSSLSKQTFVNVWMLRTQTYAEKNRFCREHHIDFFDPKSFRGMFYFLAKRDWKHCKACKRMLHESGENGMKFFMHTLLYPYYLVRKIVKERYIKNRLKKHY